jgi:hypothetical protein
MKNSVERIRIIRILRRALELKFKGKRHLEKSRIRQYTQVLEDIRKIIKSW